MLSWFGHEQASEQGHLGTGAELMEEKQLTRCQLVEDRRRCLEANKYYMTHDHNNLTHGFSMSI